MEVQRHYEAQRASGLSVQQAISNIEDIFDIYKVTVDAAGKTIVNFKINEDVFSDTLSKFTGMKFDACPRCGTLLAHRGGQPLPCTNLKCPAKGQRSSVPIKESVSDFPPSPFDKILKSHGFVLVSSGEQKNQFAPKTSNQHDHIEYRWTHPAHGKSHVLIWMYRDGKKHWILRHEQSNGIMAPTSGDTKGQLERALTYEYGAAIKEGRREEDEKDWISRHPGYHFGVYAGRELLNTYPSLPVARREARQHVGQGKRIQIKDVDQPNRSYWHEECGHLNESIDPTTLLAALQKELPTVRKVSDVLGQFDAEALKFELGVARRIRDAWISVGIDGKRIMLPLAQGEELLKLYQSNMRSLKKYVQSRW